MDQSTESPPKQIPLKPLELDMSRPEITRSGDNKTPDDIAGLKPLELFDSSDKTKAAGPEAVTHDKFTNWLSNTLKREAQQMVDPTRPVIKAEVPVIKPAVPKVNTDTVQPGRDAVLVKPPVDDKPKIPPMLSHYQDAASGKDAATKNGVPMVFVVGTLTGCGPCRALEGVDLKVDQNGRQYIGPQNPNATWPKFGREHQGQVATFNIDINHAHSANASQLEKTLTAGVTSWPTVRVAVPQTDKNGNVTYKVIKSFVGEGAMQDNIEATLKPYLKPKR